jgi:hypothetical protein
MKKVFLAVLISLSLLIACAGIESKRKSMSEDLGSPEKVALLKERVNDFWSAFVKEDYEKIYNIYDPFFRAKTDKNTFFGTLGKIKYHEFEIKDIKVEGNVARVKVRTVYSLPKVKLKTQEFSTPEETPTEFEETWLYIYDNWYKEYYLYSLETGVVKY